MEQTVTKSTGNPIHCNCGGTGRYVVEEHEERGGSVMDCTSTHLCACRLNESPRDGKVAWWTTELVKEMRFATAADFDTVTATIDRERPVSADNHRLIRTEDNSYWPTMAVLTAEFSGSGMTSWMLRDLAKWLNEVADEVDRLDQPEVSL